MSDARAELQERLGYHFRDPDLLAQALRHDSRANEALTPTQSNQRLEFLGDSILNLVVSDFLFRYYPEFPEGRLAQMRGSLVCTESLADKGRGLRLQDCVELGRGEGSGSRDRPNLMADTLEAVFGAVYLEAGFDAAQKVILELFSAQLEAAEEIRKDWKSLLQERTQLGGAVLPRYELLSTEGPPHDRLFCMTVAVHGHVIGTGAGRSKREAQQRAAEMAWNHLEQHGLPPEAEAEAEAVGAEAGHSGKGVGGDEGEGPSRSE